MGGGNPASYCDLWRGHRHMRLQAGRQTISHCHVENSSQNGSIWHYQPSSSQIVKSKIAFVWFYIQINELWKSQGFKETFLLSTRLVLTVSLWCTHIIYSLMTLMFGWEIYVSHRCGRYLISSTSASSSGPHNQHNLSWAYLFYQQGLF